MSDAKELPAEALAKQIAHGEVGALRARLHIQPPALPLKPTRGDFNLNGKEIMAERTLVPAAVLIPIVVREEPTVLFTQRTASLARHAGQVSFPGGKVQDEDVSLVETALRETREETGITPGFVTVAGFLDTYETGTGYAILPVVGLLSEGFPLAPEPSEVAEIFETPLSFLLDPKNRQTRTTIWQGRQRQFYAFNHNGHYIWGATAAILVNFAERMRR